MNRTKKIDTHGYLLTGVQDLYRIAECCILNKIKEADAE
jgi:hypothetical protein